MQRTFRSFSGSRWRSALGGVATALGLIACSSDRDATEKRLAELRDEMTRVQNTADRLEDRVSALEVSALSTGQATAAPAATADGPVYRPRLKVVHVTPETPQQAPQPDNSVQERSAGDER